MEDYMEDTNQIQAAADETPPQEYGRLADERDRLEAKLTRVKADLARTEERVREWFAAAGVAAVRLDGGRSLHLRRELWAGREDGVDEASLAAAVRDGGYPDLVQPRVSMQRLSAIVRELDRDGAAIPTSWVGIVKVSEVFRVGSRRADQGEKAPA